MVCCWSSLLPSGTCANCDDRLGLLDVDPDKEERLERTLSGHFVRERTEALEYTVELSGRDVENLVAMGPAARHVEPEKLRARIAALGTPVGVTASFRISVYRACRKAGPRA